LKRKKVNDMTVLERNIHIVAKVEDVYKYGTDPIKWHQWYVGLSDPENMKGSGLAGTTMDLKYTMVGLHLPLDLEIRENGPNEDGFIWKGTTEGSIRSMQTWTYAPKGNGTEVSVKLDYTLPGSVFGKIANVLVVEKIMENAMEQTLNNLKAICEA
jgi:hypothetical protein